MTHSGSNDRIDSMASAIRAGDRRALARGITLVESEKPEHRPDAQALVAKLAPAAGESIRIGVSGVPGVGKSTFIETLGNHIIEQGHRLAVLAVDPSSGLSGGSVLGDKTRMETLSTNPRAFIRPSPAGATLGGVTRRTREAILLCEAAGMDVVMVETVGVGQSETTVSKMTDLFLLLLLPSGGDELQGMKRGIMEIADIILVNKADGELEAAAGRAAAEFANAVRLLRPRIAGWTVSVETCSALTGKGIAEAWASVEQFRERFTQNGGIGERRAAQAREWLWSEIRDLLASALLNSDEVKTRIGELEAAVVNGTLSATQAAQEIVDRFLGRVR
ncbi:MAG TPA: methylmalonyl Co-A mutase-associated GTPase MeaB [Gammaproteobacteria bacterium]